MTRALLRDNNDAAIITPPRRRASHPDCRCIPILIVALQIEAGHAGMADKLKQIAANKRANYPKDDVQDDTRALAIDDFTPDKAGDQAENDPANY
jgi:hypothetical protein